MITVINGIKTISAFSDLSQQFTIDMRITRFCAHGTANIIWLLSWFCTLLTETLPLRFNSHKGESAGNFLLRM